jgi:hypothetical protein
MHVLILPISGRKFVRQLSCLKILLKSDYKADIMLSTSGGNICAYLLELSNWNYEKLVKNVGNITSQMLCKPWCSFSIFNYIFGLYKGSLYQEGDGFKEFFKEMYSIHPCKTEIWTGTFHTQTCKERLFCNLSENKTLIKPKIDKILSNSIKPIYANNNPDIISDYILASASVPIITNMKSVGDHKYLDGGLGGASPFTSLRDTIVKNIEESNENLHITYVNCMDLDKKNQYDTNEGILEKWISVTDYLTKKLISLDREKCCSVIDIKHRKFISIDGNTEKLKELMKIRKYMSKSILELVPIADFEINYTNFKEGDIADFLTKEFDNIKINFWWESGPFNSQIYNLS